MKPGIYLKRNLLKGLFAIAILLTSGNAFAAIDTLYTQTFDSAATNSWTLNPSGQNVGGTNTDNSADNLWYINNIYAGGGIYFSSIPLGYINTTNDETWHAAGNQETKYLHISGGLALDNAGYQSYYNANFQAPATGNVFARMNAPINTTGHTSVTISFYYLCDGGNSHYTGRLYYSTNGGTTWVQKATYGGASGDDQWHLASVTDAAFDNIADLRIGFLWVQTGNGTLTVADPPLSIDDINVLGTTTVVCPLTITSQSKTDATCGASNGTATIVATGGATSYTINAGTAITNATGIFTGLAAGTYTVSVSNGTCSVSGTNFTITNSVPAAPTVTSNSPICAGSTLRLTATDTGTVTYHWAGPNGFTSSSGRDSIINATTAATGTYSVTATVGGCTVTGSTSVTVTAGPTAPTLGSNSPVCQGDTLRLTSTAVSGGTYNWSGPTGFSSATQNPKRPNVALADSGTYSITVTVTGCTPVTATTHVSVTAGTPPVTATNNGPVCSTQTLQLNVTVVNNGVYTWSGPNGYSAGISNPTVPNFVAADSGWYRVTVTNGSCGSSKDSTHVGLTASPAAPNLNANTPICIGNTLNLTSSTVPGATYHWSGPNGFSSNSQNPNVSNVVLADSGTYSITATVAGCGTSNGSIHVSIGTSLPPFNITSNSPICGGDTLNLSVASYDTYNWTGPGSFVAVGQSASVPNIDSAKAGKYYVTVTSGGCSGTDSVNVIVYTKPVVKVPSAYYCYGDTAKLDAGAFSSYLWSTGETTRTIDVVGYDTTLLVSVVVGDAHGCGASLNITNIFLTKPDTITFSHNGDTLITSWNSASAYQWLLNGDSIRVNGTRDTLIVQADGNYSVIATDSNGCNTYSAVQSITTGITAMPLSGNIDIHPNPASGKFNIYCSGNFNSDIRMLLFNVIGQKMMDNSYHMNGGQTIPVNISTLAPGIYMVQIQAGSRSFTRKLVVQ